MVVEKNIAPLAEENQADDVASERRAQQILALGSFPEHLARALGDRTDERLRQPAEDGGVSVVEILAHLQDWEEITGDRVWSILHGDNPTLETYDDTFWNIEHDYASRDASACLEAFTGLRANLVDEVSGADQAGWLRTGIFGRRGEVTLESLLERAIADDERHLQEIREALG